MSFIEYWIKDLVLTGTSDSPQTVYYSNLVDKDGNSLPSSFTSAPVVVPLSTNQQVGAYLTETPTTTYFKIARNDYGYIGSGQILCNLLIVGTPLVTATGLTLVEMLDILGRYLQDPTEKEFTSQFKVELLNWAQDELCRLLQRHLLTELDVLETSLSLDSNGDYDITNLTYNLFDEPNGIDAVRITDGYFCLKISFKEFLMYESLNKTFNSNDPVYYVRGNKIHIEPNDGTDTTIDIYYKKKPQRMVLASNQSENVNCELRREYQKLIIGLALKDFIDRIPAVRRIYENTLFEIQNLNASYSPTDSIKFGRSRFLPEDRYESEIQSDDTFIIKTSW